MDTPSLLNNTRLQPLSWIMGTLSGAGAIVILTSIFDTTSLQYGLIAALTIGLAAFTYKTEVKRQEEEIEREAWLMRHGVEKLQPEEDKAIVKGLKSALALPEDPGTANGGSDI